MYQYNPLLQEGPMGNFLDQTVDFARRNGQKISHAELKHGRDQMAKVLRTAHSQDPMLARFARDAMIEKGQRNLNKAKAMDNAIKNKVKVVKQIGKKFTGAGDLARKIGKRVVLKH